MLKVKHTAETISNIVECFQSFLLLTEIVKKFDTFTEPKVDFHAKYIKALYQLVQLIFLKLLLFERCLHMPTV